MVYKKIKEKHPSIGRLINKHKSLRQQQTNTKSTITFLIKCRHSGIIPNFLSNSTKNVRSIFKNEQIQDTNINKSLETLLENFQAKVLNLLIKYKHEVLKNSEAIRKEIETNLRQYLSNEEIEELWRNESRIVETTTINNKNRHIRKFQTLKEKQEVQLNIIKNEEWFINKTNIEIPEETKWLLSLGPKHAIPTKRSEFPLLKFIADGEECIQSIKEKEEQELARNKLCNMLDNYLNKRSLNVRERYTLSAVKQTTTFLNRNKNILILNADKGNVTVAMEKSDYETRMNDILSNMLTYRRLTKDPTSKLQGENNKLVEELYKCNILSESDKKRMRSDAALPPRIYGLPKVHKENFPLRPICSSINTASGELCKFVANILKNLTKNSEFNVRDAVQFSSKVNNSAIGDDEVLISFDVVSLFPSIPVDFAIDVICQKWEEIEKYTTMNKELFMKVLKFCIKDNRYFKYNNKLYKQQKGLPMGSPASPIVADIVMEELLKSCIENLTIKPKLLTKYVDDLFGIIKISAIHETLTKLNSFHPQITFTMEKEENGRLPYLDTVIIRNGNQLKIDWYRKPTSSGRIINFYSCQPKRVIINTAENLIRRVLTISDKSFHKDNIKKIYEILQKNSFPDNIIRGLIRNNKILKEPKTSSERDAKIYKSMTYIPSISERVDKAKIYNDKTIKIAPKAENTLRRLFTNTKSKIDNMDKSNVVYEIKCNGGNNGDCDKIYVGHTKNKLKTRIAGHKSDVKCISTNSTQKTALTAHCAKTHHTPNFREARILNIEKNYNKRLTLEMLRIINTPQAKRINFKSDVDKCAQSFRLILSKNKKYV